MPKLRLFRGVDPLESDAIPFPGAAGRTEPVRLRLARDEDEAVRQVEGALDRIQERLNEAQSILAGRWTDDDGPKAA
jgi:hypothetical protein